MKCSSIFPTGRRRIRARFPDITEAPADGESHQASRPDWRSEIRATGLIFIKAPSVAAMQAVSRRMVAARESMPRYCFHFQNGPFRLEDGTGEVFPDDSLALQHARRIARELAEGGEPANSAIIVTDGDLQLFEVRLPENDE
jgi:hypothetical protein